MPTDAAGGRIGPERDAWEAQREVVVHSILDSWDATTTWDDVAASADDVRAALQELIRTSEVLIQSLDDERIKRAKEPSPREMFDAMKKLSDQFSVLAGPLLQDWKRVAGRYSSTKAATNVLYDLIRVANEVADVIDSKDSSRDA